MLDEALFQREIVASYVQQPRFIRRDWLASTVEELFREAGCRFVLLTAEPGAGKSAFLAQLAHDHPRWPVTFIRRDQRLPLVDASAHSFLLRLGYQLAAVYPQLFEPEQVKVVVRQRIGSVGAEAEVVAAEIERVLASPFYRRVIEIQQWVSSSQARVSGLRVGAWVVDPRLLPIDDLQFMALIDPAVALLQEQPEARIVILVDALDELRYHEQVNDLLHWLTHCPQMPANVRFLLTSRPPDARLLFFAEKQQAGLRTLTLSGGDEQMDEDVRRFAGRLFAQEKMSPLLAGSGQPVEALIEQAVALAGGNIGYLDAVARALDQAILQGDDPAAAALLRFDALPPTLARLYVFFLGQIQAQVGQEGFQQEDDAGNLVLLRTWNAIYQPILSVLAVAREPLHLEQIASFIRLSADWTQLTSAIDRLMQFLELADGRYRFYHASLPEFLTDDRLKEQAAARSFYVSPAGAHRRLADYYWRTFHGQWSRCDPYGLRHLAWHLKAAGEHPRLYDLISPDWLEAQLKGSGDYRLFFDDIGLALAAAQEASPPDILQTARLCLIQGQLSSVAPPQVIQAVARGGQIARAASLAANITFALDRCLAYALLARAAADLGAASLARQALQEAQRDLEAIDDTNRPMALSWVAEAALALDDRPLASLLAGRALQIALEFEPAHAWDHPNALFWAAKTLRLVSDGPGLAQIRQLVHEREMNPMRNLVLQTMSVAGDVQGLAAVAKARLADEYSSVRLANLALALADAGLFDLCRKVLAASDAGAPDHGGADTPKRRIWALALLGEFDRALEEMAGIEDGEEGAKALGRIVAVARQRGQTQVIQRAAAVADRWAGSDDWRILSRLAPIYFEAGAVAQALKTATEVCNRNVPPGAANSLTTPHRRAEAGPAGAPLVLVKRRRRRRFDWLRRSHLRREVPMGVKTGKRPIQLDIKPVADEQVAAEIVQLAAGGAWQQAHERLPGLKVPAFKARALLGMAPFVPSAQDQLQLWLQALQEARWAGQDVVDAVLDAGQPFLDGAGLSAVWPQLQPLRDGMHAWWLTNDDS